MASVTPYHPLRGNEASFTPPRGAMSRAVAGSEPLFEVVADYERLSAVRAAGRVGDESASSPQPPIGPGAHGARSVWSVYGLHPGVAPGIGTVLLQGEAAGSLG
jgi:hypothetical protein